MLVAGNCWKEQLWLKPYITVTEDKLYQVRVVGSCPPLVAETPEKKRIRLLIQDFIISITYGKFMRKSSMTLHCINIYLAPIRMQLVKILR